MDPLYSYGRFGFDNFMSSVKHDVMALMTLVGATKRFHLTYEILDIPDNHTCNK
jgi:hypothetical protein